MSDRLAGSRPADISSQEPNANRVQGVAAFFDMDRTILCDSSGRLYLRYLYSQRLLTWRQWGMVAVWVGLYGVGLLDFPHLIARLMAQVEGGSEAAAWRMSAAWFEASLNNAIAPGARERIEWHRAQGHHVAVVSAATPYAVQPVARALGLGDRYLATQLEVKSGAFTGSIIDPACYRQGKLALTRHYAAKHNLDLARSYFYSDSASDLPLLEVVGHPVAVNPSRKLAKIAALRDWPTLYFS